MDLRKKQSDSRHDLVLYIVYAVSFVAVAVFLFWKCKFGFGNNDESFYLSIPYRLCQGDSLFANEWHLSQMAGFLLFPFVKLYLAIFKSTEGIIISFRYLYIVIQSIISLLIFVRFKKESRIGAAVASIAFFIYAPFSINALSYNSMGIILLVLTSLLFLTDGTDFKKIISLFVSGICFAGAVLCCPYLVFVYAVYSAVVFIGAVFMRKKDSIKDVRSLISIKRWLYFSGGVVALALLFLIFVLSRAPLMSIINSFPQILNDPEHQSIAVFDVIYYYFYYVVGICGIYSEMIYLLFCTVFVVTLIDRKRENRACFYLIVSILLTSLMLAVQFVAKPYINIMMFPVNIIALECVFLFPKEKKIKRIFCVNWILGIAYSLCIHFSSNNTYYVIMSASTVSLVGSIVILCISVTKVRQNTHGFWKKMVGLAAVVLFVLQIGFETYLRYSQVFGEDDGMAAQTELITEGPDKGLLVTTEVTDEYNNMLEIKNEIEEKYGKEKSILVLSPNTWYYFMFENYRNSSYSAWLSGVNEDSINRLKEYYKINPDKFPDLIYIDSDYIEFEDDLIDNCSFTKEMFTDGSVLIANIRSKV